MADMQQAWVIAESASVMRELVSAGRAHAEEVKLVWAGPADQAAGADVVYTLDTEAASFASYAAPVARLVAQAAPDMVLVEASKDCRLVAAAVSVALDAPALTDPMSADVSADGVRIEKMVYGGAASKAESAPLGSAVLVVGEGLFEATELGAAGPAQPVSADPGITCTGRRAAEAVKVNLAAAKRVVGVGRGIGSLDNLALAQELAGLMGAEVGCTRPISEEEQWMPKECYIGVSGKMLKPEFYMAIGLSGQVQHMVGVNAANTIVAIDKDKNAPIFKQCDLGIVGDLNKVVPALLAHLR